jgi:hypothetical protein
VEWSDFCNELFFRDRPTSNTLKKTLKRRAMVSHGYHELAKSLVEGHLKESCTDCITGSLVSLQFKMLLEIFHMPKKRFENMPQKNELTVTQAPL